MTVNVIIARKCNKINQLYSYNVPSDLDDIVKVGQRVLVNFNNSIIDAYIISITNEINNTYKDIIDIIDIIPLLNEEILTLSFKISKLYNLTIYELITYFIPRISLKKILRKIIIINKDNLNKDLLLLFDNNNDLILNTKHKKYYKLIKDEIIKNNIKLEYLYQDKIKDKKEIYYKYITDYNSKSKNANYLLELIKDNKEISLNKLKESEYYSKSSLSTLVNNNAIKKIYNIIEYNPLINYYQKEELTLNNAQKNILNRINLETYNTYLLKGVANSGKTFIYINLAKEILSKNKSVLILVPDISLSSQLAAIFNSYFNDKVILLNSSLTDYDKYNELLKLKNEESIICIAVKSGIFANINNLGLIIIDEEHSLSYKYSLESPFNALKVATLRAKHNDFPLILASATPSIESYYKALNNEYTLLNLDEKAIKEASLQVDVVDMKEELLSKNYSVLSRKLKEEIINTINKNEQILLFINKRGTYSQVLCRTCGYVVKCPHCNLPLIYYSNDTLRCHNCNYIIPNYHTCPKCNSKNIKYIGAGTEKIIKEIKNIIPNLNILEYSRDFIKKKEDYYHAYENIYNNYYQVIVGTEMITKGFDFKNITLVGVLNADLAFYYPNYDASFYGFSQILQVINRSARHKEGKAIIQTYNPSSNIFKYIINDNYNAFYLEEIKKRKILNNPPFTILKYVKINTKIKIDAFNFYKEFMNYFNNDNIVITVLTEDYLFFKNNYYHYKFNIKIAEESLLDKIYNFINKYEKLDIKVGDL